MRRVHRSVPANVVPCTPPVRPPRAHGLWVLDQVFRRPDQRVPVRVPELPLAVPASATFRVA